MANNTLIIGIGNYGRSDDALGWKVADYFAEFHQEFDVEYRYQLQIEDAELIARYDTVIFTDASREQHKKGFEYSLCKPESFTLYTSHKLPPEHVYWLAKELYAANTECWVMAISGYQWELNQGLSTKARINLDNAIRFFDKITL
ncbi:hydrogenase maturation protease [Fulvivirga sedimenti]|uniref:Hydrogenase maturation protease n=1 Tax=Fulvivirga sedimenti TaxID=2879465 RepID=A0A9X1HQ73_9BACT|nr:hydrogenase maturation protease [Fulvivirga sedimenti]MCA6075122.1 hydrogenase maturation protease [Fulvivirga sedimenti]MCA6076299.1 hydrogenase maturation protease [Fulvivirga sedimenti]MCA6077427.1 hydrogenase maturation protease [Fulvivirga sedimenti]